ncbi:MAG: cell division cycle- protein [Piccolia ochrophora]|nr:MAG: cell division cycle- protein [Piccolia ochrophora]
MFEHPDDVMKEEKRESGTSLQSIMDVEEPPKLQLPHFVPENEPDSLPRIGKETLIDILDGRYQQTFSNVLVVDCRFEYEFNGGHIDGAINYNNKEMLASTLFDAQTAQNTLLVFHCEYSAHRAPIMAKFIRGRDRAINDFRYPQLTFPEMYILDGGYSTFFANHRNRCMPQCYVEMGAEEHAETCEREMGKLRRKKLSRAQTFAFGQQSEQMSESPTAPGRANDIQEYRDPQMDKVFGAQLLDSNFEAQEGHLATLPGLIQSRIGRSLAGKPVLSKDQ